ncbi:MAG: D-alanine--D-alanine ligase [Halioglobus sp.]|nr:D-alanine--D-alanine ligase [Halioglobus sp.]
MSLDSLRERRIAVLCGGSSAEREVSLQSGATVLAALRAAGFDAVSVDPAQPDWIAQLQATAFAFNALHGPGGEDGSMQGALAALGVPGSGSGVLGSALAMDKQRCKQLWRGIGLPSADFEVLTPQTDWQGVIDRLGEVFVKPACEGSSIGMARVDSAGALARAFADARQYAGAVLAERFIDGPEYTVAILGGQTLPSIRLETDNVFYDYAAKYLSDDTRYHCPSGLTPAEEEEIALLSLRAFHSLDCSVWGRVDLMRGADGAFYVLEVNTIPGMTSHSLVPMAAAAAGMDLPALVTRIVELSLEGAAHGPV